MREYHEAAADLACTGNGCILDIIFDQCPARFGIYSLTRAPELYVKDLLGSR
jgi:hypothetical protein